MKYNINASESHKKILALLRELFPMSYLTEEYSIKIPGGKTLYCDIKMDSPIKLIVEIDGNQHYKYTEYFHKNRYGFAKQIMNDIEKELWAEENGYKIIRIIQKESENISKELLYNKIFGD